MLYVVKSLLLSLVMVVGLATSSQAQKFPTFGLEKDLIVLLETAFGSQDTEKEVTIGKTKYKLTVGLGAFGKLFSDDGLLYSQLLQAALDIDSLPTNYTKDYFKFYKDGLKDKGFVFDPELLAKAVIRSNPNSTMPVKDIVTFSTSIAAKASTLTKAELRDLKVLTDLENDAVITKKSLSADKKTQTYQVDIGGTLGTFTLTAV